MWFNYFSIRQLFNLSQAWTSVFPGTAIVNSPLRVGGYLKCPVPIITIHTGHRYQISNWLNMCLCIGSHRSAGESNNVVKCSLVFHANETIMIDMLEMCTVWLETLSALQLHIHAMHGLQYNLCMFLLALQVKWSKKPPGHHGQAVTDRALSQRQGRPR